MDRDALRRSADEQVRRWETQLTDALTGVFDRQEAVVLARLQGTKARKNTRHWDPPGERKLDEHYVLNPTRWVLDAAELARKLLARLAVHAFRTTFTAVAPDDPNVPSPAETTDEQILDIIDGMLRRRLDLIAQGVTTAAGEVQQVINTGEAEGKPLDDIAEDVKAAYAAGKKTWTERIVTTNVVGTLNENALAGASHGGAEWKQWLSAHDDRVRPTHRHADGQVQPITSPFILGGIPDEPRRSTLEFPGDPTGPAHEVINCRCTILFPLAIPGQYSPGDIDFADAPDKELVGVKSLAWDCEPGAGTLSPLEFDLDQKALHLRHVRTPEGQRLYDQPIGSVIHPDVHEGLTERNPVAYAAWSYFTWAKKITKAFLDDLDPHDAKVDWVDEGEVDAHHGAYDTDPDYRASFNAWYSTTHGQPYEKPTAKYRSNGGSSLWVYADGHGTARFSGAKGNKEDKDLMPDEVTALLAKGAFHESKPHKAVAPAYHIGPSLAKGNPNAVKVPVDGLPGVTYIDERSPGPAISMSAERMKAAFALVGIEMTPGLKVNIHLTDQSNPGEQGVTWQSGPNSFEVGVKVRPGEWPEPHASLYVINNSLLHELRHVRQAQLDPKGHEHFSMDYANQNFTVGYAKNKYELDARLYGHLVDPTKSKPVPPGMTVIGEPAWVLLGGG